MSRSSKCLGDAVITGKDQMHQAQGVDLEPPQTAFCQVQVAPDSATELG